MKEIIENIFQDLEILLLHNEDDFDRGKGKFYIREFLEQKQKYLKLKIEEKYNDEELKSAFKIGFNIGYGSPVSELDLKNEHCEKWFKQFKKK